MHAVEWGVFDVSSRMKSQKYCMANSSISLEDVHAGKYCLTCFVSVRGNYFILARIFRTVQCMPTVNIIGADIVMKWSGWRIKLYALGRQKWRSPTNIHNTKQSCIYRLYIESQFENEIEDVACINWMPCMALLQYIFL